MRVPTAAPRGRAAECAPALLVVWPLVLLLHAAALLALQRLIQPPSLLRAMAPPLYTRTIVPEAPPAPVAATAPRQVRPARPVARIRPARRRAAAEPAATRATQAADEDLTPTPLPEPPEEPEEAGRQRARAVAAGRQRYYAAVEMSAGLLASLSFSSQGEITADGLVPEVYEEEVRGRRRGVRIGAEVRLHNGTRVPRPAAVQDIASQFVELDHRFSIGQAVLAPGAHSAARPRGAAAPAPRPALLGTACRGVEYRHGPLLRSALE